MLFTNGRSYKTESGFLFQLFISVLTVIFIFSLFLLSAHAASPENEIPQWQLGQMVTEASFKDATFTPNGDNAADMVEGSITVTEQARYSIWIINAAGVHVNNVLTTRELSPGTHSFTWDGKDFMGDKSPDGPYRIKVTVGEGNTYGSIVFDEAKVLVEDSRQIQVPEPVQRVKVVVPVSEMTVGPYAQTYRAKQGEIFPIILGPDNHGKYHVLVNGSVPGTIDMGHVELIDLDTIPLEWGTALTANIVAYSGPSASYPEVANLSKGEQVRILRQDGTWYRVLLETGSQGYIRVLDLNTDNQDVLVKNVAITNKQINPRYSIRKPLTNISIDLVRKSEVTVSLTNGYERIYLTKEPTDANRVTVEPGRLSFDWDGRSKYGHVISDGDYKLIIYTRDLASGTQYTWTHPDWVIKVTSDGPVLPESRVKEIIPAISFTPDMVVPGLEEYEKSKITVTLAEQAEVKFGINNKPEIPTYPQFYMEWDAVSLQPGEHTFEWKGMDPVDSYLSDGEYYLYFWVKDSTGAFRNHVVTDKWITIKRGYVPPQPDPEPAPGNTIVHTVVAGDTLWKLAQKYGTTVSEIANINNIDPNKYLYVGQKLVIPGKVNPGPKPFPTLVHTVTAGESLWKIAQKYGTTIGDLAKVNNLDPTQYLYVGQELVIPSQNVPTPIPSQPVYHTVQPGDSLWIIAQKYGTTVDNLVKLNQIDPNDYITPGQRIKVSI